MNLFLFEFSVDDRSPATLPLLANDYESAFENFHERMAGWGVETQQCNIVDWIEVPILKIAKYWEYLSLLNEQDREAVRIIYRQSELTAKTHGFHSSLVATLLPSEEET